MGLVGAAKICQHFQRYACFYHGLDDPEGTIDEYGLASAVKYEDDEYDQSFEND